MTREELPQKLAANSAFRPCPTEDVGVIIAAPIISVQTVSLDSAAHQKEKGPGG
jgi:hypothetical protein